MNSLSRIKQFRPILFLCLQPAAHCHPSKRNAVGNALASLDTFDRFYVHLSSLGLSEKVRENSYWDCSRESSTFCGSYQLSVMPKHTHTHTLVLSVVYQSPTIRGSEIGNGYFQQLPDVSGDLEAKQLSQLSKGIVRRKRGNEKWLIFLLKLQSVVMVA